MSGSSLLLSAYHKELGLLVHSASVDFQNLIDSPCMSKGLCHGRHLSAVMQRPEAQISVDGNNTFEPSGISNLASRLHDCGL